MHPRTKTAVLSALVAACGLAMLLPTATARVPSDEPAPAAQVAAKKNIIFILTDDLSANLVPHMSAVSGLKSRGTTFSNYFVADSLCCPSRATIFTGEMPHNTGVRTNTNEGGDGGFAAFKKHQDRTYAVALDNHEYRTGYFGKYLNGYKFGPDYNPPKGWDEWHVSSGGYGEFDYRMTRFIKDAQGGPVHEIDQMRRDPQQPDSTYLTDVLARRAVSFVNRSAGQPFFLQVSTFSPHSRVGGNQSSEPRFPAAVRDRPRSDGGPTEHGDCGPGVRCDQIRQARGGAFDENTADKPPWVRRGALTDQEKRAIDKKFRDRVRMVQSVNDMIEQVLGSLTDAQRQNTYVVFSSDNGFHLGQHRLLSGKGTAYDHDIQTPLVITGPGVLHQTVGRIAQNVDLYPTFLRMADINPPDDRDGRSLLGLANGEQPAQWRKSALVEHKRLDSGADPDAVLEAGNATAPTYQAIRTAGALYVRYASGTTEYYDLATDPAQVDNRPGAAPGWIDNELARLGRCGKPDQPTCWAEALEQQN